MRRGLLVLVGLLALTSCKGGIRTHVKPPPDELRIPQTAAWLEQVRSLGRDGDWLVIRGYHKTDDLVVVGTRMPLSHAAVLDQTSGEIIEAIGSGVQTQTLDHFVDHAHRIILIRPKWSTDETGPEAVRRSREVVGSKYDFLGTVGLPAKNRFYCSELATWAYGPHGEDEHLPKVIEPGQMYLWGTILWDSGPRD